MVNYQDFLKAAQQLLTGGDDWQTFYDLQQTAQRRPVEYEKIQKTVALANLIWSPT